MKNCLNFKETLDLFSISRITLFRWIKTGRIRFIRPGKKYFFPQDEIDRLLSVQGGIA